MKKLLIAGAALAALIGTPALAADMAAPVYKAPPPMAPVCVWCGWYIGLNAGWVGSANSTITNTGTDTGTGGFGTGLTNGAYPPSVGGSNYSGFIGGGQIGYNYQVSSAVFGIEGDFDGIAAKHTTTVVFPGGVFGPNTQTYNREADWLSTIRGRLGFTATPQFLIYGTGGFAVGEVKVGSSVSCPLATPPCSAEPTTTNSTSTTATGWTAGAGFEWMFMPHWSVKAEYLYADLGKHSSTLVYTYGGNTSSLTSTVRDTMNIARAGINWHF